MGALGTVGLTLVGIDLLRRVFGERPATSGVALGNRGDVPPAGPGRKVRAPGIRARVGHIRAAIKKGGADARVREMALGVLTKRCGDRWCHAEKDWRSEATALFDFVRGQVRYTLDPVRHDTYVSAARTLGRWHGGDCDDLTIALGALLESVGHKVGVRVVQTDDAPTFNHIYLLAYLPEGGAVRNRKGRKALTLDASVDEPAGWEVPNHRIVRQMDVEV